MAPPRRRHHIAGFNTLTVDTADKSSQQIEIKARLISRADVNEIIASVDDTRISLT